MILLILVLDMMDSLKKLLDSSKPEQYNKGLDTIDCIENSHTTTTMVNIVTIAITNSEANDELKDKLIGLVWNYVCCRQLSTIVDFKSIKKPDIEPEIIQDINIEI